MSSWLPHLCTCPASLCSPPVFHELLVYLNPCFLILELPVLLACRLNTSHQYPQYLRHNCNTVFSAALCILFPLICFFFWFWFFSSWDTFDDTYLRTHWKLDTCSKWLGPNQLNFGPIWRRGSESNHVDFAMWKTDLEEIALAPLLRVTAFKGLGKFYPV